MLVVSPSQHFISIDIDAEEVLAKWGPTTADNSVQKLEFGSPDRKGDGTRPYG